MSDKLKAEEPATTSKKMADLLDEIEKELKEAREQVNKERKTLSWHKFVEIRTLVGHVYVQLYHATNLAHGINPINPKPVPQSKPKPFVKGKLL